MIIFLQAMISMILSWRIIPRLFGDVAVVRLPFEPPALLQKATHRGLVGADPREGSAVSVVLL